MESLSNLVKIYTSRSAIESGGDCTRHRYLRYRYGGIGLDATGEVQELAVGSAVHKGVEVMATKIMQGMEVKAEDGIRVAIASFRQKVSPDTILVKGKASGYEARQFAYDESIAMIEALTRLWFYVELPKILRDFTILAVELDVANKLVTFDGFEIWLETKADLLLRSKQDKSQIVIYSLKTLRDWGGKEEKSYNHDLQGVTEIWGMEQWLARVNRKREAEGKKRLPSRITAVRMCVLVKGGTKEKEDIEGNGTGLWFTYNPFIRGYRSFGKASGSLFAHSWYFDKGTNKSGRGALGRGWTPFYVWEEYKGGVGKWMADIWNGEIQPEYSEQGHRFIFEEHVIVPPEKYRMESEIRERMEEVRANEIAFYKRNPNKLELFMRNSKQCYWPRECPYTPICWGDGWSGGSGDIEQMMEEGMFRWRIPHHRKEAERALTLLKSLDGKK